MKRKGLKKEIRIIRTWINEKRGGIIKGILIKSWNDKVWLVWVKSLVLLCFFYCCTFYTFVYVY